MHSSGHGRSTAVKRTLILVLTLGGCVQTPRAPDLERALVFDTQLEKAEIRAGQSMLATFTVRNVTAEPVDTCIDGDGVSVIVRAPNGNYRFPITLFGSSLHAACPNETRFEPGEARTYRQRVFTLVDFPADRAVFEATLALRQHPKFRTRPETTYAVLKSRSEVRVKAFTAD